MRFVLALRNLVRAPGRLAVSLAGVTFSAFLMAVQGGLLYGFTQAASRVVDALDADIWIVRKGVPCFDFVSALPRRYADLSMAAPGVGATGRGVAGWAPFAKPSGDRTFVLVVGVEAAFRGRTPAVRTAGVALGVVDAPLVVDRADVATLGVAAAGGNAPPLSTGALVVEVGGMRGQVTLAAEGFSSFLGTPFVFAGHEDARAYLRQPPETVGFVLVRTVPGADAKQARDWLRTRLPDADVWTREEFSWRSRTYWLLQTGAGGALTLAALLGFAIGLVVVAQTTYSLTSESVEEYATLRAMGARDRYVRSVVLAQSLACGAMGGLAGLLLVAPFEAAAKGLVTWISVPLWMYALVAFAVFLLCAGASLIGARPALVADPGRVFRA